MKPIIISFIVFIAVFGGSLLGILYRSLLEEHHLSEESRSFVLTIGLELAGVIAAFVLALGVTAAQGNFQEQHSELNKVSAKILSLNKILSDYGNETKGARNLLRESVLKTLNELWPDSYSESVKSKIDAEQNKGLSDSISLLKPNTDYKRSLQKKALELSLEIDQTRNLLLIQQAQYIPRTFLIVLVLLTLWFIFIFFGLGIYAPINSTVVMMLALCALSVAIAFFMIIDLNLPFDGILRMPSAPFKEALQYIS